MVKSATDEWYKEWDKGKKCPKCSEKLFRLNTETIYCLNCGYQERSSIKWSQKNGRV